MKHYIVLCLLFFGLLAVGCGHDFSQSSNGYVVRDGMGTEVHIKEKPKRIYATTVNLEETVLNIVGADRMVAVSEDLTKSEIGFMVDEAKKVKKHVPTRLSPEQILALAPDLVILHERDETTVKTLRDLGLMVFVLPVPSSVEEVKERVRLIGLVTDEQTKSEKVVSHMDEVMQKIQQRLQQIPKDSRKIAIAYSAMGAFGTKGGIFHEICTQAGVINGAALAGLERGDHLGKESILKINPDVFIFPIEVNVTNTKESVQHMRNRVAHDPAFANIKAVKNEQYIFVHDRYRYATSHDIVKAIQVIHEAVYGKID